MALVGQKCWPGWCKSPDCGASIGDSVIGTGRLCLHEFFKESLDESVANRDDDARRGFCVHMCRRANGMGLHDESGFFFLFFW